MPEEGPWFEGKQGTVLLFRVNRRERGGQGTLFREEYPSVLAHMEAILDFSDSVTTGRRYQRVWRLGNEEVQSSLGLLTGRVGFSREQTGTTADYDDESLEWRDVAERQREAAWAPFVYVDKGQVLGVLRHPEFDNPNTLAKVFQKLLERGEEASMASAAAWEVEPMLDEQDFYRWLAEVDVVERVTFVVKRPNPDALEEFAPLMERLERLAAASDQEVLRAQDPEVGLRNLDEDERTQMMVAAARESFGRVTARGQHEGHDAVYDQGQNVQRESIPEMPGTPGELLDALIAVIQGFVRRRSNDRT